MSFKTDKPFYPYREPKTETPAEKKSRVLWVWFVGAQRMNATIGERSKWPAVMNWSNTITTEQRQQIASNYKLPVEQIPDRLTEFIDESSPRPATDELYFHRLSLNPSSNLRRLWMKINGNFRCRWM